MTRTNQKNEQINEIRKRGQHKSKKNKRKFEKRGKERNNKEERTRKK
jgi:hypothetical protein